MNEINACSFLGIAQMFPFRNNPSVAAKLELPKGKFGSILIDHPAILNQDSKSNNAVDNS
jgi:hypothetical protein